MATYPDKELHEARRKGLLRVMRKHSEGMATKDLVRAVKNVEGFSHMDPTFWNLSNTVSRTLRAMAASGEVAKGPGHTGSWKVVVPASPTEG